MTSGALRWFGILFLACATGCGSGATSYPVYKAKGKVSLTNGTALSGGRIEFQPMEGGRALPSAHSVINPDGTFVLETYKTGDGAIEGDHRVLVVPPVPMKPGETVQATFDSKYTSFDKSGLKYTVTKDPAKNEFDIKLDAKK